MNVERAIETQRRKLLRLVAGWLALVVFVSVGPFSRDFPRWITEFIASVLGRAECAAHYLVIAQARLIADRNGSDVDHRHLSDSRTAGVAEFENAGSLSDLRERLEALKALLKDLPRQGLRLLRRTGKRIRRLAKRAHEIPPIPDTTQGYRAPRAWRLAEIRIERPPDKRHRHP